MTWGAAVEPRPHRESARGRLLVLATRDYYPARVMAQSLDGAPLEVGLRVSLDDLSPSDEVDMAARELRLELLDADVGQVELVAAAAPAGAKAGTGSVVGDIALAVLPALLPKVIDLLIDWGKRGQRSVKLSAQIDGAPVEITLDGRGADPDAVGRLVKKLRASKPGSTKRRG